MPNGRLAAGLFPVPSAVVFEQVEGPRGLFRDARDEVRFVRTARVRGDNVVWAGVRHGDGNVVAAQGAHRLEGRDGALYDHDLGSGCRDARRNLPDRK